MRVRHRRSTTGVATPATTALLVHGLGVSTSYMVPLSEALVSGRDWQVMAPDMPGHGASDTPHRVPDVAEWADMLATCITELAPSPPLIVANSFGCQAVVELARQHPTLVRGLVLVGPTTDPHARSMARHALRLLRDQIYEPARLIAMQATDYVRTGPVRTLREYQHGARHDMSAALTQVQAPVLVLRGEHDTIVPERWARTVADLAPRGAFATIRNAGHACHFSRPQAVRAAIDIDQRFEISQA
ncbi:MAG: hypothetical protein JWN41_1361 [Thermoleophilia bacterium]|nr:hypothetical protein [Thermoleophilia bacterium]